MGGFQEGTEIPCWGVSRVDSPMCEPQAAAGMLPLSGSVGFLHLGSKFHLGFKWKWVGTLPVTLCVWLYAQWSLLYTALGEGSPLLGHQVFNIYDKTPISLAGAAHQVG